jgi:hypothetical protein
MKDFNVRTKKINEEWRLVGCYGRVALVRTDVSEELSSSIIRMTRIGELGTTIAVTSTRPTQL